MPKLGAETRLKGLPISGGTAVARVCFFNENRHSNLPMYKVEGKGKERELARLKRSTSIVAEQLETLKYDVSMRIGSAEAEIFAAQKAILLDNDFQQKMQDAVGTDNLNAESAIIGVLDMYETRLQEMDNEYIRERSTDIGEIKRRLLDILSNMNPSLQCAGAEHCHNGRDRIVVAEELTPRLTLELDTEHTIGFVTERGGVASHAAILARSLGIPAVSGMEKIHDFLSCGTKLFVNGYTGELILWPSDETLSQVPDVKRGKSEFAPPVEPVDGFKVFANISLSSDVPDVTAVKAEGIGLYRTEFEFIAAHRILGEDEQFEHYASVVKSMNGKPVYFRLLDIGGDKQLSFLNVPKEENPCLGLRGARFLIRMPELLGNQARALARASQYGPVYVMYPMIVDLEQFLTLKNMFLKAVSGISSGQVKHGVMFEVPSACLQAEELFKEADFASIGSNDLIQYLFAVDRNNENVAYDYNPGKTALWSLMKQIARSASNAGKELSICGELAGDPQYVSSLIELGITAVSLSPRLISDVRNAARSVLDGR